MEDKEAWLNVLRRVKRLLSLFQRSDATGLFAFLFCAKHTRLAHTHIQLRFSEKHPNIHPQQPKTR
jgi:hypothetical protein